MDTSSIQLSDGHDNIRTKSNNKYAKTKQKSPLKNIHLVVIKFKNWNACFK